MIQIDSVTWLMPILNGMPYLPMALESVRSQTCGLAQLLVWDNGSTDGTLELLNEWIPHKIPGRVFRDQPLSLGLSLRALVEQAQTPFCARMDADDISLPTRLERQLSHLVEHPEMAANATDYYRVDENTKIAVGYPWFPHTYTDILHGLLFACRFSHPTVLFRRQAVLDVGSFRDEGTSEAPYWPEDYDLWQRLFARHKTELLPDRLLLYRHQSKSLSQKEIRLNRNREGRARVFAANAAVFAGINDMRQAKRLYLRDLPFSLPTLWRISTHLSSMDGVSVKRRWRMRSFLDAAAMLTSSSDFVTRTWISAMRRVSPPIETAL
jgi:glycosyltransferase involved in cell wall biosynthesis